MIRALGAALVAFGALWAGWRAVEELRGRVRAAEAVIDGLELLERELWERDRMGRVYQTLSLAGGAFLVILLL